MDGAMGVFDLMLPMCRFLKGLLPRRSYGSVGFVAQIPYGLPKVLLSDIPNYLTYRDGK